jgi:hypothetical protein
MGGGREFSLKTPFHSLRMSLGKMKLRSDGGGRGANRKTPALDPFWVLVGGHIATRDSHGRHEL